MESLFSKKSTEISIPLSALNPAYEVITNKTHSLNFSPIPSDVKASTISKLNNDEIKNIFDMTLESLDKSIDFIEETTRKD